MSKAARDKSNSVTPRIVIGACITEGADAALKGFIDDWFVPALVEDYIRLHKETALGAGRDADLDGRKSET